MKTLLEELSNEDIAPWRQQHISQLLVNWLQTVRGETLEAIAADVATGNSVGAQVGAGGLEVIKSLLSVLHPPAAKPEIEETPFVDPATRRSLLKPKVSNGQVRT